MELAFGECRMKYTNTNNIPKEIIRAVSNDSYSKGASTISVTGLLQPPRIRILREEYDDDIISSKSDKFKQLTMDIVWEFSFFLTMQSVKLTRTFQMFLGKEGEELEQAKEEFLQLDSIPSS